MSVLLCVSDTYFLDVNKYKVYMSFLYDENTILCWKYNLKRILNHASLTIEPEIKMHKNMVGAAGLEPATYSV